MPVEFGAAWIRPFYGKLQRTWEQSAVLFDENPVDVFNRNVWIHIFHERDPKGLSISASPSTTSCSDPTSRIPKGWRIRSPTTRS